MVTYTDNKKLNKPANGEYPDTWDVPVNQDWDIIDKALGSAVTFTVGASDITLTISDAQNQRILLTGTPGATRSIIIPFKYLSATTAVGGMWVIENQTNASQYIVTEVSGSAGVLVSAGRKALVYSDGINVNFADDARILQGTGIAVSGSQVSLVVPVAVTSGGTGQTTWTANNVLLGNGTSAFQTVAPGTSGNVLTSDGTTWYSAPASGGGGGGGITSLQFNTGTSGFTFTPNPVTGPGSVSTTLSGQLSVAYGGTGAASLTGLLKGNGTGAITGSATVSLNSGSTDITGTLSPLNGGTGVTSINATVQSALGTAPQGSGSSLMLSTGPVSFSGNFTASGAVLAQNVGVTGSGGNALINFNGSGSQYISVSGSTFGVYVNGALFAADTTNFAPSKNLLVIAGGSTTTNLSGAWVVYSDARTKKDVNPYPKGTSAIDSLNPVTYQYNGDYGVPNDGVTRVGLIAQDVLQSQLPELVYTVPYTDPNTGQVTQIYQLNPGPLVYTLINSIKELNERVKALEAKVGP